jgi:hypothetical protein
MCRTFSAVFECELPGGYACALKICPTGHLPQHHFARLLREVRVLPWLAHPNIVQFLGYVISNSELRYPRALAAMCVLPLPLSLKLASR